MGFDYEVARRYLDIKFRNIDLEAFARPPKGWIRAIRDALGITTTQLAKRLGVAHPRIIAMEKDEILGSLKLSTLERVADALDCQLVYAFVPRQGLAAMVQAQAEKKAKVLLKNVEHSMLLEDQLCSNENDARQMEVLIQKLLNGPQARLWDEE